MAHYDGPAFLRGEQPKPPQESAYKLPPRPKRHEQPKKQSEFTPIEKLNQDLTGRHSVDRLAALATPASLVDRSKKPKKVDYSIILQQMRRPDDAVYLFDTQPPETEVDAQAAENAADDTPLDTDSEEQKADLIEAENNTDSPDDATAAADSEMPPNLDSVEDTISDLNADDDDTDTDEDPDDDIVRELEQETGESDEQAPLKDSVLTADANDASDADAQEVDAQSDAQSAAEPAVSEQQEASAAPQDSESEADDGSAALDDQASAQTDTDISDADVVSDDVQADNSAQSEAVQPSTAPIVNGQQEASAAPQVSESEPEDASTTPADPQPVQTDAGTADADVAVAVTDDQASEETAAAAGSEQEEASETPQSSEAETAGSESDLQETAAEETQNSSSESVDSEPTETAQAAEQPETSEEPQSAEPEPAASAEPETVTGEPDQQQAAPTIQEVLADQLEAAKQTIISWRPVVYAPDPVATRIAVESYLQRRTARALAQVEEAQTPDGGTPNAAESSESDAPKADEPAAQVQPAVETAASSQPAAETPATASKSASAGADSVQPKPETAAQPKPAAKPIAKASGEVPDFDPNAYQYPPLDLLAKPVDLDDPAQDEWVQEQSDRLDTTLAAFHVDAHVVDYTVGPTVTQFQVSLAAGVRVNKIANLNDDLKLALAAKDIRIEAPIPGKNTVGIEIPNLKARPVMLSEVLSSPAFKEAKSPLTVALGVDLFGHPVVTNINKMPHGLIAGATGSGKSVFINSLLVSLLYKATPAQVRLLLIDPKAVELAAYNGLPHLVAPVISDPKAAAAALKWAVDEMEERYQKMAAAGVRNLAGYNEKAEAHGDYGLKLPYIVIIIDELADLMMVAASEVQDYIARITQKARAAGIHLIVATQRPSVDVITGTIKNNIPTRIAFMVASQVDSRTIIDTAGAERLLGRGDMLYLGSGASQPIRLQGTYVEDEIEPVVAFVKKQLPPHYLFQPDGLLAQAEQSEAEDELFPQVLTYIASEKQVSTSKLQRVFSIGYNRAANLIDELEMRHYVSPANGSKPRDVYLTKEDLPSDNQ